MKNKHSAKGSPFQTKVPTTEKAQFYVYCSAAFGLNFTVCLFIFISFHLLLLIRNYSIIVVTHIKQALLLNIKTNSIVKLMSWIRHDMVNH